MTRSLGMVMLAVVVNGCAPGGVSDAQPSPEALAREVLTAIQRRDEARLNRLVLSEDEFEHDVWPGLPAARPERNLPRSYVWADLSQKSNASLRRTLDEYGGRSFALEAVRFAGASTNHGNYRVFRDAVLAVREGDGTPGELRLFGSMIHTAQGWKVFSYVVDR